MHMRRLIAKGGYGEHGRSCFLVEYDARGHYYMVDCGIMDTDSFPYPHMEKKELEKTDYLFLTHCHKDHSGAFSYFVENGFNGLLIASEMTLRLAGIEYDKVLLLPMNPERPSANDTTLTPLKVTYGRSGHCPGGLWFLITDERGYCFFSGDYQADTLLYACDQVRDMQAKLAVIDMAHNATRMRAGELREMLCREIEGALGEGYPVILPVPHYGRGIEMLFLLLQTFPQTDIRVDTDFVFYAEPMLTESCWYREEAFKHLQNVLPVIWNRALDTSAKKPEKTDFQILLIADTHLQREKNREYVQMAVEDGAKVIITGRVKAGSYSEQLLKAGKAVRYLYPHHQSMGDVEEMLAVNHFDTVLPFHNGEKEVWK